MLSTEGPALVVADFNQDGLEDVFIGASRDGKSAVFLQQKSGKFIRTVQPALENDSNYEDVASCVADVNQDGFPDLVLANGGNEFYGQDEHLTPRVYLNDGKGIFKRAVKCIRQSFYKCILRCCHWILTVTDIRIYLLAGDRFLIIMVRFPDPTCWRMTGKEDLRM